MNKKYIVIIKLVIMIPLSYFTVLNALMLTGGGHGNYLPLIFISGPMNFLFQPKLSPLIFILGTICLFEIYALLVCFFHSKFTLIIILLVHIISSIIALPIFLTKGYLLLGNEPFILIIINLFFLILPTLIIGLLFSFVKFDRTSPNKKIK